VENEDRYDSLFMIHGDRHSIPWRLLKAQVKIESDFNPDAVNPKSGATGLAQFMPRTWEEWEDGTPGIQEIIGKLKLLDPRDPEDAINAQASYMAWLLKRFEGMQQAGSFALAAYNWGIGNLKKLLAEKGTDNWRAYLPPETDDYVEKVQKQFDAYSRA